MRCVWMGCLVLATGCAAPVQLGMARTLTPGKWQVAVAGGASTDLGRQAGVSPAARGSLRVGVEDGLEVGLTARPVTVEADAKVEVLRSSSEERGVDVAVVVSGGYGAVDASGGDILGVSYHGPLLGVAPVLGLNVGVGHQVVFSPRAGFHWLPAMGSGTVLATVGATFGVVFRFERFLLEPFIAYAQDFAPNGGSLQLHQVDGGLAVLIGAP